MGGIPDDQVEWAVVNRLGAMLQTPPETKFNVTQSFAIFSAALLWSKNRLWVGGDGPDRAAFNGSDHAARDAREALGAVLICEAPWSLARVRPGLKGMRDHPPVGERINADFEQMNAGDFIRWLRNAIAHGDGRTIKPIQKTSLRHYQTYLAGFEIRSGGLTLSLYHADIVRIGSVLSDTFCRALSGNDQYAQWDVATANIVEAA